MSQTEEFFEIVINYYNATSQQVRIDGVLTPDRLNAFVDLGPGLLAM